MSVFRIRCKVTLQSYIDNGNAVDLTPFLRSINISKNLYQSSGTFNIQLLPAIDKMTNKSWYYRSSPMDYIEIKFTRDWASKEIPTVLRGFVDKVGVTISVDEKGAPLRIYTLSGRDMGKIFDITRIYYLRELSKDLQLIALPGFKQFEQKYGFQIHDKPSKIIDVLFNVASNQLKLIRETQSNVPEITYLTSQSILGDANQFSFSQEDGSIWEMMSYFNNSPWNELFTVDLKDGFYLVFRETPWKEYPSGAFIQNMDTTIKDKTLGETIQVPAGDILRLDISRSDTEVKNYFFTYPTQNIFNGKTSFKAAQLQFAKTEADLKANPYLISHDDKDAGAYRFGFRRFENNTEILDLNNLTFIDICKELNENLEKAFKLNGDYESGHFVLKGNSALHPGCYMVFNYRTGLKPEYYVVAVEHELSFIQNQESFTTTIQVERGDGYLRSRDAQNNNEPRVI